MKYKFDFSNLEDHWQGGFADYPSGNTSHYDMKVKPDSLPAPLDTSRTALMIQGINRSDDLFMFLKKRVAGLPESTSVKCRFEVRFATDARPGSVGIGGSPASSVFFKVGAVPFEPLPLLQDGFYRMNIDKGNQSREGRQMIVIGNASNGVNGSNDYTIVTRSNEDRPFLATTSPEGDLWLIVGTDSGFEGLTRLYYTEVVVEVV